jgi:MYXO-CTERM domain-containing protein
MRDRIRAWISGLPDRHGRTTLVVLALIVLLALGLRLARATDEIAAPGPDSEAYSAIASHLYKTGEYGTPGMENESDWSPGAVLTYTAVYTLTGGVREEAARYLVALVGAALVLVVYALGRRLARAGGVDERIAGLVAAGATAIYPAFVYDAGRLMSEPFAEIFLAGFVLSFLWASDPGRSAWAYLAPGVLLGLTSLFRPEYLPFSILFTLLATWWAWRNRRAGGAAEGPDEPERAKLGGAAATGPARGAVGALAVPAMALLAGFALMVVPWTVRNAIELDRFIPVTTGGGKALFIGTYLPGDGDHYGTKRALYYDQNPGSDLSPDEVNLLPMQPILNEVAGSRPELDRDAALGAIGKDNLADLVTEQPGDLVAMMGRKVWRMWRSGSGPGMDGVWQEAIHASLALAGLGGLVLLALRRRREALVIALLVVGITAIGAVLLASTRRNLILMPIVIALAGVAVSWLAAALSSGRSWSPADPSSPRSSPPS